MKKIVCFFLFLTSAVLCVSMVTDSETEIARGKKIFDSKCARCHKTSDEKSIGPGLKGAKERAPNKAWLYQFVKDSKAVINSGDVYANELFVKYKKKKMPAFPKLSDEDIDAIFLFVDSENK
ncbi:MAG: c-type cytochrome [Bacteroidia bacterium]